VSEPPSTDAPRVSLLVKDPSALYAFWNLPPSARDALRPRHGDRAASLAQVTLRIDEGGVAREVIPPAGTTSHYLATESTGGLAQVELGWTLPSGRFEAVARSESVSVPRASASDVAARATLRFPAERDRARKLQALQVRKTRPRPQPDDRPASAGGSDAFRPARRPAFDVPVPGGSDAFPPAGGRRSR
jgi:hypothetical protein